MGASKQSITNLLTNKRLREQYKNIEVPSIKMMLRKVLRLSLPSALEAFLVALAGLIDIIMVSQISKQAVAAVAITQQPYYLSLMFAMALSNGVGILIARRKGQHDEQRAKKTIRQAMLITVIISLILSLILFLLANPFMRISGASSETLNLSTTYFQVLIISLVAISTRLVICAGIRATGNTHIPLFINLIANGLNIFLNYCLINGNLGFPALGVFGAGLASSITNAIALIISLLILIKYHSIIQVKPSDDWHFDLKTVKGIVGISTGAFLEQFFMRIGFYILAIIINNLGTEAVAINAAIFAIISLAFAVSDGFAVGTSALVGQSLGEKKPCMAFIYGRISLICNLIISIIMVALLIIVSKPLISLFTSEAELMAKIHFILIITSFIIIPQSLQWIVTNVLKGAGDIKYSAISAIICILIIRPTLAFIFCYPMGLGVLGSWLALFFDQITRFIINFFRVNGIKWLQIKV